jgi:hypothetical protein
VILAWRGSHLHKWVQSGSLLLVTIASALALSDVAAEGHGHGQSVHGKLGILTLTLFLVQGALGWAAKYLKTKVAAEKTRREQMQVAASPMNAQATSTENVVEYDLARPYALASLAHRSLAGLLLLFLAPLTALFGLLTATGLIVGGETMVSDNKNLAAHVGFGGAIVAGAVAMLVISWQNAGGLNTGDSNQPNIIRRTEKQADAPLLPLRHSSSLLVVEYLIWFVSSIVVILSQHDWRTPMEYDGMDIQHVMMGIFALVSSLCGLTLTMLTRAKLCREASSVLSHHPPGSLLAFKTTQQSHLLTARLPAVALYVGLAAAMLGHAHGEPFSDNLHYMFALYCILYGLSKLIGVSPWVHLVAPTKSATTEIAGERQHIGRSNSITGIEGVLSRHTSPLDTSRHLSRRNSLNNNTPTDTAPTSSAASDGPDTLNSAWQGVWINPEAPMQHTRGDSTEFTMKREGIPSALSTAATSSSTPPSTPPSPAVAFDVEVGSAVLSEEEFQIDWSATDGVESAGRYMLLSTYLLLTAGITFSGSSKYGLIAASKKLSPGLYIVTLAIVSLIVLTWINALIEGALDARSLRSKPSSSHASSSGKHLGSRTSKSKKGGYQHVAALEALELDGISEMQEKI